MDEVYEHAFGKNNYKEINRVLARLQGRSNLHDPQLFDWVTPHV